MFELFLNKNLHIVFNNKIKLSVIVVNFMCNNLKW